MAGSGPGGCVVRYAEFVTLVPIVMLQLANGTAWILLGAANLIVLLAMNGAPLFGWLGSFGIGVAAAAALAIVSVLSIRGSLTEAEPAVGVDFAPPSEAVGRCIGPVALATLIMVVLAVIPGAGEYRGLAGALFLVFGVSYLPLAYWVRHFEEAQGVIVTQPVNRYGLRTGPVRTLRLPR